MQKVEQAKEQLTEAEKRVDDEALVIAEEASVSGVVDALSSLRHVVNTSFIDLSEKLTSQTQRLQAIDRAIELKESRLEELHDIDVAADGLAKLTRLYEERRAEAEAHFIARTAQMRAELTEERASLQVEIAQIRRQWETDRAEAKAQRQREAEHLVREREREQADYLYERDMTRKREEDDHAQRRATQERELAQERERVERDLAEREARIDEREQELRRLTERAASFPEEIEAIASRVEEETTEAVEREYEAKLQLARKEQEWEARMLTQSIGHLRETIEDLQAKIEEQKREISASGARVQHIAERAVEGASMSRAYSSLNDLAMEQARRPERQKPGE